MDLNCPNCGTAVPHNLKYAKLASCPSCQVALFLEDEVVKHAGERNALADAPSLFAVGVPFTWRHTTYVPHGRVRFVYGDERGFWDEWWVSSNTGESCWMSVDEGDIAMEQALELNGAAPAFDSLSVGSTVSVGGESLRVTEKNFASCLGFEGEIPEVIQFGEKHAYVHLLGANALLLTVEYSDESTQVFKGNWIDPFEIETL